MTASIHSVRRQLDALHGEYRNAGMNPVESLAALATRIRQCSEVSSQPPEDHTLFAEHPTGDLLSLVYQEFLASEARNGLGQYLTPLPVAEFVAQVCRSLGVSGPILDPFCGSGLLLDCFGRDAQQGELVGVEINGPVAEMATALATISGRAIRLVHDDAFSAWEDGRLPHVGTVVTNPPFGAVATTARLDPAVVPQPLRAMGEVPAELLGLELSVSLLEDGGVLGIVLPQSVLTNRTWNAYRSDLFSRVDLLHVVSLPEETFAPFRGVARACVLFARKRASECPQVAALWRSRSVGYDNAGRSATSPDLDAIARGIASGAADSQVVVQADGSVEVGRTTESRGRTRSGHRLGDVAEVFTGKNPARTAYVKRGPWLLKVGGLSGSMIAWKERARTHVSPIWFTKNARYHLQLDDICMTAAAHRPKYIGLKVDIIDELPPEGAMPSGEVMAIRLHPSAPFTPVQLLYYFRSADGYGQIQDMVRGSTGHLYPTDVHEMVLPPLESDPRAEQVSRLFHEAARAFREYRRSEDEASQLAGIADLLE